MANPQTDVRFTMTRREVGKKAGKLMLVKPLYVIAFCVATALTGSAQTFTTLLSFSHRNGAQPNSALAQGLDGNFYGTADYGGTLNEGTIFGITPGGTITGLWSFQNAEGCYPAAGFVQTNKGSLYGTTSSCGADNAGTVYEVTTSRKVITLYSFCSQANCADGSMPYAGLIQSINGNFYGTTFYGGTKGGGTIFEISAAGKLTTLYNFCSQPACADGFEPYAALIEATDGNFYGTTIDGGANKHGTVFKATPAGELTTLYSFCSRPNCADGSTPYGRLLQATDGNFYGTTADGGASNHGTAFEITGKGGLKTLHSFDSADGSSPNAGLVQATDGSLYGTTPAGGASADGTIFKMAAGSFMTLHTFDGADGSQPGPLVQGTDGDFYGTTYTGGASSACVGGCGTVFSLSTGLGSFVETLPAFGKPGAVAVVLGTDLTGATKVSFNGTAATFKVVSSTEIVTAVPVGATTGTVEVTTPSGVLNSNTEFFVIP